MPPQQRTNGFLEMKFNEDRTQALATIYPGSPGGTAIYSADVLERLKRLGVTYGVREQAIREAIHYVEETHNPAVNIVVAQGALPHDGADASVHYLLPQELLSKALEKDAHGLPDWFALDPRKLVEAEQELVSIVPPQPGVPGKTLTWPIQQILPRQGKPAPIHAGANVRVSDDGLHLYAAAEGYACLHNEVLTVHALRQVREQVTGGQHEFATGAVFLHGVEQAEVYANGFVAIRGEAQTACIRAHGDLFVHRAANCTLIADGTVTVVESLENCQVITARRIVALPGSSLVGGTLCATEGVEADSLGAADFTRTEVQTGADQFSPLRAQEIEKELHDCEANIGRIRLALKPFVTLEAHAHLPEEMRTLLQKLQAQRQRQEERVSALHGERRQLLFAAKADRHGLVTVTGTAHPGVWIGVGSARVQIEAPLQTVTFTESPGGKSVQVQPLRQAA